jgi:hypothetical protein
MLREIWEKNVEIRKNKTGTRTKTKKRTKKNTVQINFDFENYTCKSHIPTVHDAKLQEISMYRNGQNMMLN